jgi:hypothetical protein
LIEVEWLEIGCDRAPSHDGSSMIWFSIKELLSYLNLRLGDETKGLQVEYHQMGRLRVDKKIFGAPQW